MRATQALSPSSWQEGLSHALQCAWGHYLVVKYSDALAVWEQMGSFG